MLNNSALASFVSIYLFVHIVDFVLLRNNVLSWPFHAVQTASQALMSILEYLSVSFLYLVQLFWLPAAEIFQYVNLKFKKYPLVFCAGLVVSLCYSIWSLSGKQLHPIHYWWPVVVLAFMNSTIEESVYRLVFFVMLEKRMGNRHYANLTQALFYSLPHYYIDPLLGLKALLYGVLLGYIVIENNNIMACIACHFIVDIGAIGVVMMTC